MAKNSTKQQTIKQTNLLFQSDVGLLNEQEKTNTKEQLKSDEGYSDVIYRDSEGYLTFGYGHKTENTDPEFVMDEKTPVDKGRIECIFEKDLKVYKSE